MKKITRRVPLLLLVMLLALPCKAAFAASVTVSIRQAGPDSSVQTVTCTLLQKDCDLPFTINAGQTNAQTVNIHIVYFSGGLALDFKTAGGYFYTDNGKVGKTAIYSPLWHAPFQGNSSATHIATLFLPLSPSLMGPSTISSTPYTSVASLNITTTPVP